MNTNTSVTARIDERLAHFRIGWLLAGLLGFPCFSGLEASNSAVLDIGNQKQLFLDLHVVESLTHAKRVLNPADKHPVNPLVKPDRPWEGHYLGLGRVLYDEDRKVFRMWYGSMDRFTWWLGRFCRQLGPHWTALCQVPGKLSSPLLPPGNPGHRPGPEPRHGSLDRDGDDHGSGSGR